MLNVRDICKTEQSKYWWGTAEEGTPGWQRITVALVVDGLEAMDKTVLDILATIGVYQDGVMKKSVNGKNTVAHIFEVDSFLMLQYIHFDSVNSRSIQPKYLWMQLPSYSSHRDKTAIIWFLSSSSWFSKLKVRRRSILTVGCSMPLAIYSRYVIPSFGI